MYLKKIVRKRYILLVVQFFEARLAHFYWQRGDKKMFSKNCQMEYLIYSSFKLVKLFVNNCKNHFKSLYWYRQGLVWDESFSSGTFWTIDVISRSTPDGIVYVTTTTT